jgi:hypothetical protein
MPYLNPSRGYHQNITWWAATRRGSGFDYAAPVLLRGRWEEVGELYLGPNGNELVSNAVAYLPQDVKTDDFLIQGDYTSHATPAGLPAFRVLKFTKTPNVSATVFERKAYL